MSTVKWIIGILSIVMMLIGAWFLSKFVFGILVGVIFSQCIYVCICLHKCKVTQLNGKTYL